MEGLFSDQALSVACHCLHSKPLLPLQAYQFHLQVQEPDVGIFILCFGRL